MTMPNTEYLTLAGVPVILRPPAKQRAKAPLILLWHGFGLPNSEEMLAETLPLETVPAWKAYLGLPLFGQRLPEGGIEEIMRRQVDDYVLKLLLPVAEQAMNELPEVVLALQERYPIDLDAGIGLFGFSAGGLTTLLTLAESNLPIATAVLAGVTKELVSAVDTYERYMKEYYPTLKEQYPWLKPEQTKYIWSSSSEVAKQRLDFIARAAEIAKGNSLPALLFVHGVKDEIYRLGEVEELYAALLPYYEERNQSKLISLQAFQHLGHHLDLTAAQDKPEILRDIAALQVTVADWFSKYLVRK